MSAEILIREVTINPSKILKASNIAFEAAEEKAALQFLTWVNAGSPAEPATPPIRWGVLRGSSSVFVKNKFVSAYPEDIKAGANETPDPLRSYNGEKGVITIVYNLDYAFKMHEERGKTWQELGPYSSQSANATDKWLEKHIAADGKILYKMIARLVGTELEEKFK
jgi:hypothetical protein